jgi:hypothetical protein
MNRSCSVSLYFQFFRISEKCRKSDQYLICYFKTHTGGSQWSLLYMEVTLKGKYWIKYCAKLIEEIFHGNYCNQFCPPSLYWYNIHISMHISTDLTINIAFKYLLRAKLFSCFSKSVLWQQYNYQFGTVTAKTRVLHSHNLVRTWRSILVIHAGIYAAVSAPIASLGFKSNKAQDFTKLKDFTYD